MSEPTYRRATLTTTPTPLALTLTAEVEPGYPAWYHFTLVGATGQASVDFGDGETLTVPATVETVDHVYAQPGDYTVTATAGPDTATLPLTVASVPAIVTPNELEQLLGLSPADADRAAALTQLTIEAYLWPNPIPDPVPPPMHVVGLALSARFAGAELTKAGAIVGETIGSYSYRLATPLTFDSIVVVLGELADELQPWAPAWRATAYDVDTSPGDALVWPADYWQRNLDRLAEAS